MPGTVITFYSYKGGVGRSFALANVAVILAQWGARVLVVDWDIEAPGLNHYFAGAAGSQAAGVLDFIDDCQKGSIRTWDAYAAPVSLTDGTQGLYLMPAMASSGADYTSRVQNLDWDELYDRHRFGARLEELRAQWVEAFDFVLVDSRTGVTDFSGLTTAQLPDVLVFMFTANAQSLMGCADIARRAMDSRRKLPINRPALIPLPIPARFEQREEYERAQQWRARFATELVSFLDRWRPADADPIKLFDLLTIPYVPRWTFGEDIAALQEPAGTAGTRTPGQAVSFAIETIAALIAQSFARVGLLTSSRDEYVHAARASVRTRIADRDRRASEVKRANVFVSHAGPGQYEVGAIAAALRAAKLEFVGSNQPGGVSLVEESMKAIEGADAYVVLMGPSPSEHQAKEIADILRQTLRSDQRKPVIPVILPGGEKNFHSSRLADFFAVKLDAQGSMSEQLSPVIERLTNLRDQTTKAFSA
jgi:MinD-like ATPase involved in chromosome partitioning or flagellar assembly